MTLTVDPAALPQQRLALDELRSRVAGAVHLPDDEGYAAHATAWNLSVPMRPLAVVAARTAGDVVEVVRFAARHGLTVGVQATGHGAVSSLAGHLLVSTRDLDEVVVHATGWARVGAGAKWLPVIEAAASLGLAPLNGSSSDVGVVGYTTGGGVGPLARTFGLAADRVRAFDVVTGDGVLRRVTPTQHSDLYFALRGGKGAAGIVTAIELDLVPLAEFYGGALYFDAADAADVVARWRAWSADLPEQATTSFVLFQLPALPEVPPPLAGRLTVAVRYAWVGDAADGEALLAPMRAAAPLLIDDVALKPYTAIDSVHADPVDPMPVEDPAVLLRDFPAEAAERLLALAGPGSGSPQVMVEVRQLGGAYAREPEHPSAFVHRDARYSVLTVGMAFDPGVVPHSERLFEALADWDTGGIWPNFGAPHDERTALRAYGPEVLARLRAVAAAYDPLGVLQAGAYARRG